MKLDPSFPISPGPWTAMDSCGTPRLDDQASYAIVRTADDLQFLVAGRTVQEARANAALCAGSRGLLHVAEMVRDADNDCKADGMPTMPDAPRASLDAAIHLATGKIIPGAST